MSLRDKAREVKAAGEAERGNFTPHGVPKRIFQWWLSESNTRKARKLRAGTMRENFCHFWRVVLIWAPLRKLWYGIKKSAPVIGGVALLVGIVCFFIALFTNPIFILEALGIMAAGTASVGGLIAGISAALTPAQRSRNGLITHRGFIALWFVVGFPTAILSFLVTKFAGFYDDHLTQWTKQILLTVVGLVLLGGALTIGTTAGWLMLLEVVGIILAFGVVVVLGVIAVSRLSDYLQGKRKIAEGKRLAAQQEYINKYGALPVEEPSAWSKFWTGFGDFVVLLAQVVRVKKWGICPLVEIENDDEERIAA